MATTLPVGGSVGSLFTMGDTIRRILNSTNEPANQKNQNSIADYINDALESVWMSMLLATLSRFSKGPVNRVFSANQTTFDIITVPDPTISPVVMAIAGGTLGARTIYFSYCLVTDSGSTTLLSPRTTLSLLPNQLSQFTSPVITSAMAQDVIGYYIFAGVNADGSDQGQQTPLLPIGQPWVEGPAGIKPAPSTPYPPTQNTTGDNIFNIVRIDVQNVDQTWTNWIQSNLNSTWFTEFQKKVATTTTWNPFCYDFIGDRQLEVRPAPGADLTGTYFFTTRPRRLRFMQSRLPYPEFAISAFINDYAKSKFLLDIYEYEASDRWKDNSEKERARILLQVGATNFNQNTTIRPFMR